MRSERAVKSDKFQTCDASEGDPLASRKFNVFIDSFVAYFHLRAFGNDKGEVYSLWTRALSLQQNALNASQNQIADRMPLGGGLCFQLPIKRRRNVHRSADRIAFHKVIVSCMP